MTAVLDASALLAYLQAEPGSQSVQAILDGASMSTVNWTEVVQKARAANVDTVGLRDDLAALGLALVPFTTPQAELAGALWERTRKFGLSLGDRACLALGLERGGVVYTADRAWARLDLGVEVRTVR